MASLALSIGLIGRYAVPKFDVRLELVEYQGAVHPIVIVPGGIETPVVTRSGFERELRQSAIYVRTISNGRPSSCEPVTPADWDKLLRICFDHREADIGRFLRRHLSEILQLVSGSREAKGEPATEPVAVLFLKLGRDRFKARWSEKFGSAESGL
jgi:hypothetical protein